MRNLRSTTIDPKEKSQIQTNETEEEETWEDGFLMKSFVWVFRSPDGRYAQTDLHEASHEAWWDVALSMMVAGRVLVHIHKWFQR